MTGAARSLALAAMVAALLFASARGAAGVELAQFFEDDPEEIMEMSSPAGSGDMEEAAEEEAPGEAVFESEPMNGMGKKEPKKLEFSFDPLGEGGGGVGEGSSVEPPIGTADVEGPAPAIDNALSARFDYLRRESAAEREEYWRVTLAYETANMFLNPSCGVELRTRDSQLRTYWIGDDIRFSERHRLRLRLNHTEYGDWETSVNYFNAYLSYQRWWLRLAIGIGYASLNFDPEIYQNPLDFASDSPETRFIYNLSIHPTFWDGRLALDVGLRNHDNFEYHGFDDTGYHAEAIWNITDSVTAGFMYERRYSAAFISVPTLTRTTWMGSIEVRFP